MTTKRMTKANKSRRPRDANGPCSLRGILPTPPEVETIVARELKDHPVTEAERRRLTEDLKLQFYFGGEEIAYRETEQGKEVLAVGLKEIGRLLRELPYAEHKGVVTGQYPPW